MAELVVTTEFLDGGVDSLSVLYPADDPAYHALRPRLALPASAGTPFAAQRSRSQRASSASTTAAASGSRNAL